MKNRILLATLLAAVAIVPAINAQETKAAPAAEKAKEPQTPLGEQMDKMNAALRKIRSGVNDATKNDATIVAVGEMRTAAQAAMKLEPKNKAEKPDAAKYVSEYQARMKEFLAELDKLEASLKAGNNTEAAATFAKIGDMQKASHKEFRAPAKK